MKRIKTFKSYSNDLNEGITDNIKRAGQWLWDLVKNKGKIPVRNKKYNPDTESFEIVPENEAGPVVKIHLPQGMKPGEYKFTNNPVKKNPMSENRRSLHEGEEPQWMIAQKTQDPQIEDVSTTQLIEELAYHFENPEDGRPLLIWGAPGIGKTSIVKDFGLNKLGVPVIEVILSLMEPTDVAGLPGTAADATFADVKRSVNYLPMIWPLDNGPDGKGGIIFLDEINRAHPSVQAAMLKVVLDREIAGANYKIPSKWLILAAANRPEDEPGAMIRPMSFALANRFAQVNLISAPENWVTWARSKGLSEEVISFVELLQEYFYVTPESLVSGDVSTTMGVTPRSWAYAAKEFSDRSKGKILSKEEIYRIFSKHVGKKVGSLITDFIETTKFWPTQRIAKIFNNPTDGDLELPRASKGNYDLPKAYAILYMASRYKQNEQLSQSEFLNLLKYLDGLNAGEIAMSALNMVKRIHPEIKNMLGDPKLNGSVKPFIDKYKGYMREI